MKFFEEYPEFNGYAPDPPYLLRIKERIGMPNNPLNRTLLNSALERHQALPRTLLDPVNYSLSAKPESPDWIPYKSPFISDEEAGIRTAYENAKMEAANRELLLIARQNYERLYADALKLPFKAIEDNVRVLLLPKLLEKMIAREEDPLKRFNQEFLKDGICLWMSEMVSTEPSTNVLYYPYHMILDYMHGNQVHKRHLRKFFNDKAREVIESRLVKGKLFSDRKEFFDFTTAHPSDWHSAAHQNTPVEHGLKPSNIEIPQYQALGDYSLGALTKGYTMPASDGSHYICISNAYSFVNDSFDFEGFQWLGNWDFENGDFSIKWPMDEVLFNKNFRIFAKRTNHGRDFRVVSPLYEIPKQELEFNGKEIIDGDICWKAAK